MKKFVKLVASIATAIYLLAQCTPSQQVIKPREIKGLTAEELFDSLTVNDGNFETFIGKFSASYSNDKGGKSFKGQIRIQRDSLIWISISPGLGVELLRVMLLPDSVHFMNRIHKQYYSGDYSVLKRAVNIDFSFSALQAALLNEFFIYPFSVTDTITFLKNMEISNYHKSIKIQSHKDKDVKKYLKKSANPDLIVVEYILDVLSKKMSEISVNDYALKRDMLLQYSTYDTTDAFLIPEDIVVKFKTEKNFVNFDLHYTKKQFDKEIKAPFNIPNKYTAVQY